MSPDSHTGPGFLQSDPVYSFVSCQRVIITSFLGNTLFWLDIQSDMFHQNKTQTHVSLSATLDALTDCTASDSRNVLVQEYNESDVYKREALWKVRARFRLIKERTG